MPIYYTVTGTPIFSRSLIDIVERTGQTQKDLDWNAVFSFLEFGFCHSNLTFFKDIKKCAGDCIYKIENGCIHTAQFVRGHSDAIDIKIAKEIAVLLNRPLHVMEAKAFDEFTDESFLQLCTELDGMYMPLVGFQLLEAYKKRQQTGCTYNIGGLGGEYYKTFFSKRIRTFIWYIFQPYTSLSPFSGNDI